MLCPWLYKVQPGLIDWFYDPDYLVGYIFVANLIMSAVQMLFFIPELCGFSYRIDRDAVLYSRTVRILVPD